MPRNPHKIVVKINLGFMELSGEWEPNNTERRAAWELYIELVSRISIVPLDEGHGLLREALTSLHSIFDTTRNILRHYGPDLAEPKSHRQLNFAYLAITILNTGIRPLLTQWHPTLSEWEDQRPPNTPAITHENNWSQAANLRNSVNTTRTILTDYAATLANACSIPNLLATTPTPPNPTHR